MRGVPVESYVISSLFPTRAFFASGRPPFPSVFTGSSSKRALSNFSGDASARRLCRLPRVDGAGERVLLDGVVVSCASSSAPSSPSLDWPERRLLTPIPIPPALTPSSRSSSPSTTLSPSPPRIPRPSPGNMPPRVPRPHLPRNLLTLSFHLPRNPLPPLLRLPRKRLSLLPRLLGLVLSLPPPPVAPPAPRRESALGVLGFVVRVAVEGAEEDGGDGVVDAADAHPRGR